MVKTGPVTPDERRSEYPAVERIYIEDGLLAVRVPVPPAYESDHETAKGYLARTVRTKSRRFARKLARAESSLIEEWDRMHRAAGAYEPHEMVGSHDCEICGEGVCYWLHITPVENESVQP